MDWIQIKPYYSSAVVLEADYLVPSTSFIPNKICILPILIKHIRLVLHREAVGMLYHIGRGVVDINVAVC
jgi:hypothetical protein